MAACHKVDTVDPFIIRRNRVYSWRRTVCGTLIQLSLGTTERGEALALSAAATAASVQAFESVRAGLADTATARRFIRRAVDIEKARRTLRGGPMHFFWYQHLPPRTLRANGWSDEQLRQRYASHPPPADDNALLALDWTPEDIRDLADLTAPTQPGVVIAEPGVAGASAVASTSITLNIVNAGHPNGDSSASRQIPTPDTGTDQERPKRRERTATRGTRIDDLTERLIAAERKRAKVNEETANDTRRAAALFSEITGVDAVESITQAALAAFIDALETLPPNYRKSEADRRKPIADIIREAAESGAPVGLSASTVNKQLTALGKLLRYARTVGVPVDPSIDISLLRISDKQATKDKRDPFTLNDIRALFRTPSLNADADQGPLWWISHLAAYTGARREELAGLDCADIESRDGVAGIVIRDNPHRRIKNGQSARFIPVHSHIIEIGFLDYGAERRAGLLFPLKRKSRLSGLGDSIDYRWRKAMREAGIPTDGKRTFHSFRHYAVQTLIDKEIDRETRGALFGHLIGDIQGDTYGGDANPDKLRRAVEMLPRVR